MAGKPGFIILTPPENIGADPDALLRLSHQVDQKIEEARGESAAFSKPNACVRSITQLGDSGFWLMDYQARFYSPSRIALNNLAWGLIGV